MKAPLGLADLVRAAAQLVPLGDDPTAIARLLGLAPAEIAAPAAPTPVEPAPSTTLTATTEFTISPATSSAAPGPTSPPAAPAPTIERGPVTLRALGRREGEFPTWMPPPGKGMELAPAPVAPPPLETLFEPRRHRALMSAALTTFDNHGPLDLERLIEQVAARQLTRDLPRTPEASLRRGAWLLLDRSPAMAPFFDDVEDLAARIERVVGRDATRVQRFTAAPDQVWDAERFEDRALELPPPGTPLVAITDLGQRSNRRGWRGLLRRLLARGSRAIAIVPYPAARAPGELRDLATVVSWDRTTKVRTVRPHRRSSR